MKTVVIGGGPAGMISAYFRALGGEDVTLYEKNEKLGKKLYITGKGRGNVTTKCDAEEFLSNGVTNPRFLFGAARRFSPSDFYEFLEEKVPLKVERGNRVFPVSDKASDITKCLEEYIHSVGVEVRLNDGVKGIIKSGEGFIVTTQSGKINCDNVIVCTGGKSYPLTGSDGDGYLFAEKLGHKIIKPKPALVGIELCGSEHTKLQGLSLKNVSITVKDGDKTVFKDFGEMLFTHFGISGPIVLTASSKINKLDFKDLGIFIDLKPAIDLETLDARILRDFEKYKGKTLKNSLGDLLLKSLIPIVLDRADISGDVMSGELKREERKKLAEVIKGLGFKVSKLRPVEEAIVTSGGVDVGEVNPKTMESKLVKGLYFAGEVLDVDALTGGFNITIAACTGYVAGNE